MSTLPNRLLILALLSVFVVSASAAAVEKDSDKDKKRVTEEQHDKDSSAQRDADKNSQRDAEEEHQNRHAQDRDSSGTVKTAVFKVSNHGGGPLTITTEPTITRLTGNGNFEIVPPGTGIACAASLVVRPDGGECSIGVRYTPSGSGKSIARLTLTDSGAETSTQEALISSD